MNWKVAVPRVVPQPIDFNNLQCQTSLTALTGAKGIFLCCQTGTVTKPNRGDAHASLPPWSYVQFCGQTFCSNHQLHNAGVTAPSDKIRSRGMQTGLSAKPADNLSSAKACA